MTKPIVRTVVEGDCRDFACWPVQVDMVFTDPPYGISNKDNTDRASAFSGYNSDKGTWDVEVDAQQWVPLAFNCLKPSGIFACFGTLGSLVSIFYQLEALGMRFQSHITWHKTNPAPSVHRRMLTHANEIILVYSKGAGWCFDYEYGKTLNEGKQKHNHWDFPCVRKIMGVTRKPPILCEQIVRLFTRPGDVVLDPFAGSGGIPEGAEKAGRSTICIEKDPALCVLLRGGLSA